MKFKNIDIYAKAEVADPYSRFVLPILAVQIDGRPRWGWKSFGIGIAWWKWCAYIEMTIRSKTKE